MEIAEGAGTIALELCRWPEPYDAVLIPFGNGALLAGVGTWLKSRAPSTDVIGVCAEVERPSGERGVPLLNFAGWLGLTAGVALAYQRLGSDGAAGSPRARATGGPEAGRDAALLLLSYYLPAVAWATKRHRREYLLYSAPFSVALVLWAALKEYPATP